MNQLDFNSWVCPLPLRDYPKNVEEHAGMVVSKTALGATRVVDMQLGEQLPRIC